jgi:hypothetical protein
MRREKAAVNFDLSADKVSLYGNQDRKSQSMSIGGKWFSLLPKGAGQG